MTFTGPVDTIHSPTAPSSSSPPTALLARLGRQTVYALTGFPLALIGFVVIVTGLSLSAGLLITFLGIPVLIGTLLAARGMATVERSRMANLIDPDVQHPIYTTATVEPDLVKRAWAVLRDPQSWLDALHAIVGFPLAIASWTVVLVWWATAISGTTWALWGWTVPAGDDNTDLPELLGLGTSYGARAAFYTAIGVVFTVTLPWAVAIAARAYAGLGHLLLVAPSRHRRAVHTPAAVHDD